MALVVPSFCFSVEQAETTAQRARYGKNGSKTVSSLSLATFQEDQHRSLFASFCTAFGERLLPSNPRQPVELGCLKLDVVAFRFAASDRKWISSWLHSRLRNWLHAGVHSRLLRSQPCSEWLEALWARALPAHASACHFSWDWDVGCQRKAPLYHQRTQINIPPLPTCDSSGGSFSAVSPLFFAVKV